MFQLILRAVFRDFKSKMFYGMSPKINIMCSEYFEQIKQKDVV
jgi:hypothetical protein